MDRAREQYLTTMTEDDILAALRELTLALRGRFFHVRNAHQQELTGLPDAICLLPGVSAFFELKTQADQPSPEQLATLSLLQNAPTVATGILRPVPGPGELSLDEALAILTEYGGRRR